MDSAKLWRTIKEDDSWVQTVSEIYEVTDLKLLPNNRHIEPDQYGINAYGKLEQTWEKISKAKSESFEGLERAREYLKSLSIPADRQRKVGIFLHIAAQAASESYRRLLCEAFTPNDLFRLNKVNLAYLLKIHTHFPCPILEEIEQTSDKINIYAQTSPANVSYQSNASQSQYVDPFTPAVPAQTGGEESEFRPDHPRWLPCEIATDPHCMTLLKLLPFLTESKSSIELLSFAERPRKTWNSSGEIEEKNMESFGLNEDLIQLLSDLPKLDKTIKQLESYELVSVSKDHQTQSIDMSVLMRRRCFSILSDPYIWKLQAFRFLCYVFPIDGDLEPLFGYVGRAYFIDQVQHVIRHYGDLYLWLPRSDIPKAIELLISASYFRDSDWKFKAIETAKNLSIGRQTDYLSTWVDMRHCALAALTWKPDGQEECKAVLQSMKCANFDARCNALYGHTLRIHALFLLRADELDAALTELNMFSSLPEHNMSSMERLALENINVLRGQILRIQGKFEEAYACLKVIPDVKHAYSLNYSIQCHKASVLSEMGKSDLALHMLEDEVDFLRKSNRIDTTRGHCLQLSMGEVLIVQGRIEEAQAVFQRLNHDSMILPASKIGTLRLQVGLARVSHLTKSWVEAKESWIKVKQLLDDHGWGKGFMEMVIYFSLSHIGRNLGQAGYSQDNFARARALWHTVEPKRQHWVLGLGSSWLDFILDALDEKPTYIGCLQ